MADRGRDDSGQYTRRVSDEQILSAIRQAPAPVVTATSLAEQLPIGARAVRERLHDLESRGRVERMDAGAQAVVWWATDSPTPATAESAADRLGGFGLLRGEVGDDFATAVSNARTRMNAESEEREDALFGE